MRVPSSNQLPEIIKKNHIESAQAFYLQGGFDQKKHHGIYRFIVIMMTKKDVYCNLSIQEATPHDRQMNILQV